MCEDFLSNMKLWNWQKKKKKKERGCFYSLWINNTFKNKTSYLSTLNHASPLLKTQSLNIKQSAEPGLKLENDHQHSKPATAQHLFSALMSIFFSFFFSLGSLLQIIISWTSSNGKLHNKEKWKYYDCGKKLVGQRTLFHANRKKMWNL